MTVLPFQLWCRLSLPCTCTRCDIWSLGGRGEGSLLPFLLASWVMKAFGFYTSAWNTMVSWCQKARRGAPVLLVRMRVDRAPAALGAASCSGWLLVASLAAVAMWFGSQHFPGLTKVVTCSLRSLVPGSGFRHHSWKHNLKFVLQLPLHTPVLNDLLELTREDFVLCNWAWKDSLATQQNQFDHIINAAFFFFLLK